jgi:hypothetical protein
VLFVCCVDQKVYKQLHSVSNQVKEAKMVSGDLRLTDGKLSGAPKKKSPDLSM